MRELPANDGTPDFAFIRDDDFRRSLEADYAELRIALAGRAWKAVHVLAGSIIEAVLADQLLARNFQHPKKNVLELDLFELISSARQEDIISQRAVALADVIRSYRNLIHPGRLLRLKEVIDQDSASVVSSLVNMILRDIARSAQSFQGFTATSIVEKVRSDPSSTRYLTFLLEQVASQEMERLVLHVLPKAYQEDAERGGDATDRLMALQECFHVCVSMVGEDVRRAVSSKYVKRIETDSQANIRLYDLAFFRSDYLKYIDGRQASMVKQHLFALIDADDVDSSRVWSRMQGLALYVEASEALEFSRALIHRYLRDSTKYLEHGPEDVPFYETDYSSLNCVATEYVLLPPEQRAIFLSWLEEWIDVSEGDPEEQAIFIDLKKRIDASDELPF